MVGEDVLQEIGRVAGEFGFEAAALAAIAEVESGGRAFAMVERRAEPLIRFEGHYFDRLLSEKDRALARQQGLASPRAGAVGNPGTQAARWRLVRRACEIDRQAALESVSWGLGQVMGSHWRWLGFASIDDLVAEARSGAAGQARLMALYLAKSGLAQPLREHDWEAVARGYNGPGYARNGYHVKLAAAYERYALGNASPKLPDRPASHVLLRRGMSGEAVRDLQRRLSALGYPAEPDGVFGKATEKAVRAFQRGQGLDEDGIAGPKTGAAMAAAMPFEGWFAGLWAAIRVALLRLWRLA